MLFIPSSPPKHLIESNNHWYCAHDDTLCHSCASTKLYFVDLAEWFHSTYNITVIQNSNSKLSISSHCTDIVTHNNYLQFGLHFFYTRYTIPSPIETFADGFSDCLKNEYSNHTQIGSLTIILFHGVIIYQFNSSQYNSNRFNLIHFHSADFETDRRDIWN